MACLGHIVTDKTDVILAFMELGVSSVEVERDIKEIYTENI